MAWRMMGLLAAVGATMYALVPFAHGYLVWLTLAVAAAATFLAAAAAGLAASPVSVASPAIAPIKKIRR